MTEKIPFLYFLANLKYRALLVGVVVAVLHFVISFFLEKEDYPQRDYTVWLILNSPSFALLFLNELDLSTIAIFLDISILHKIIQFLIAAFPSLLYGIAAGFMASRKPYLKTTGIVFICLLIFFGSFLLMMMGLLN
jgi:hypothetical protein